MTSELRPYAVTRDSGVGWIGAIPGHWRTSRLGYAASLLVPMRDKPKELVGEIPWVRIEDVSGMYITGSRSGQGVTETTVQSMNLRVFPVGTVLCSCSCSMGATAIVGRPLVTNQTFIGVVPRDTLLPEYVYWLLGVSKPHLDQLATGAIQQYLSRRDFASLEVVVPPKAEQEAIVRFLRIVDRRTRRYISAKQKLIKLLQEQKQAVIHQAVTRGLNADVALKPSGVEWLGEVPKHWEVRKVGAVSTRVTKGTTPTTLGRGFVDEGVRFVKVESISQDRKVIATMCSFIDLATDELLTRSRLRAGDVLGAIAGAIGRVAVVAEGDCPANCNQAVAIISPHGDQVSAQWLSLVLSSPAVQTYLSTTAVQSAQANLSLSDLRQTQVPLPPRPEQTELERRLNDVAESVNGAIARVSREIELVKEYRTGLIAAVVTGKVDVRATAARLPDEVDEPELRDGADTGEEVEAVHADDLDVVHEEAVT